MTTIFKRLRGATVTIVSWGVIWALLGIVFRVIWPPESGLGVPSLAMLLNSAIGWIAPGAIGGGVFAVLVMGGGRERLEDLSMRHVAITGALAGALLPGLMVTVGSAMSGPSMWGVLPLVPQFAIAGGLCGAGSLALARRPAPTAATLADGDIARAT